MRGTSLSKLLGASLLLAALPADANVNGTITKLSTATATDSQSSPAISSTNVVWTEASMPAGGTPNFDIFLLDLATGLPATNITNTPNAKEILEDVDGTNVVWTSEAPEHPGDIVIYDTTSGTSSVIASSLADAGGTLQFEQPSISGAYVTFLRVTDSQIDVAAFDQELGLLLDPVTNDAAVQAHPRVGGDYIVYEDYNSGNADVFGYQISTERTFPIATGAAKQITPDVAGTTVVWVESGATSDQVFISDLVSGSITQITTAISRKISPRLSKSRIVWSDDRNGNLDLFSYDLVAGREDAIVTGPGDQYLSDIDGDRVVYTSNQDGAEEIFMFTFAAPTPPPPPPIPAGCDPALTDVVSGPTTITTNSFRPHFAFGSFDTVANKKYSVCVENGLPDGSRRTALALVTVDWGVVLTPANFRPLANPPHYVTAPLFTHGNFHFRNMRHWWSAALFGAHNAATITVTIRVAK